LASNESLDTLKTQSLVDQEALKSNDNANLTFDQCTNTTFSDEQLSGGLRKAEAGNEDV